ncbi:hypothetical protein [Cohnella soli]|uniref:Uncharacterized protein n=1 Tax=Cohnella soli TaxID=425005 RepID=A0ABW0HTF7_9BACL
MLSVKNLYIKSWLLAEEEIEAELSGSELQWKRMGRQFFFAVTPETYEKVLDAIRPLNNRNGSMIHESDIDYVNSSPEEIDQQIEALYEEIGIEAVTIEKDGVPA